MTDSPLEQEQDDVADADRTDQRRPLITPLTPAPTSEGMIVGGSVEGEAVAGRDIEHETDLPEHETDMDDVAP